MNENGTAASEHRRAADEALMKKTTEDITRLGDFFN